MLPLKNAGNIDVQLKLKVILTFTFLIGSGVWVSLCDILGSDCGKHSRDPLIFCLFFFFFFAFSTSTFNFSLSFSPSLFLCAPVFFSFPFHCTFLPFCCSFNWNHFSFAVCLHSCLQCSDNEDSFSVTPNELTLRVGEEHAIVVSFKAQGNRKCRDRYITFS